MGEQLQVGVERGERKGKKKGIKTRPGGRVYTKAVEAQAKECQTETGEKDAEICADTKTSRRGRLTSTRMQ